MRTLFTLTIIFISLQASAAAVYFEDDTPQARAAERCGAVPATPSDVKTAHLNWNTVKAIPNPTNDGNITAAGLLAEVTYLEKKFCSGSEKLDKSTYCTQKLAALTALQKLKKVDQSAINLFYSYCR